MRDVQSYQTLRLHGAEVLRACPALVLRHERVPAYRTGAGASQGCGDAIAGARASDLTARGRLAREI
ncbi:hypothetical protein GCM10017056_27120 [Seohaeicola zhoushanensis]|uniref:Uncharacterized protein n=1 Tax=Seohaeicola zhoushanensis TaxID=1569283 RepID=A0A8J3GXK9_9RHOB|nr:hypothetical protein GCM10017056_27120 [Seohaeicola zhoushanensis]